jgi:hypothetical protein
MKERSVFGGCCCLVIYKSLVDSCAGEEGSLFSPTSRRNELFPLETVDLPLSLGLLNMETVAKSINFYEGVAAFRLRRARHTQLCNGHHTTLMRRKIAVDKGATEKKTQGARGVHFVCLQKSICLEI